MRICPKCGDYYADSSLAFCLADGTPLVGVDPGSPKWSEGARVIQEKANALIKQKRRLKWRRVSLVTMMILTLVAFVIAAARSRFYLEPPPPPPATPTPTPSPSPTPTRALYKVKGRVMNQDKPLSGIKIMISGAELGSMTTDADGNYAFSGLPAGSSYTITPQQSGTMTFKPPNHPINKLTEDVSVDFVLVVYKISGRVMDADTPLPEVSITLFDGVKTISMTTDKNGQYAFSSLPAGGKYTITPSKGQMVFNPSRPIDRLTKDETVDFKPVVYKISGRVMDADKPLSEVSLRLFDGTKTVPATTGKDGKYAFSGLPAGARYTITPTKGQMVFDPPVYSIDKLTKNESVNFDGRQTDVYKISGQVTEAIPGMPAVGRGGVQVVLKGGANPRSERTDEKGRYTFTGVPAGGSYSVSVDRKDLRRDSYRFDRLGKDETADFVIDKSRATPTPTPTRRKIGRVSAPTPAGIAKAPVMAAENIHRDWRRVAMLMSGVTFSAKTALQSVSFFSTKEQENIMSVKESSATALVRFTGLGIVCFNKARQRGEIGIIRDQKHELSIRIQQPAFQEGGTDVISYQDIATYQTLPKDDVQIEIKALGKPAIEGYEIYQSGDFDRLSSADLNDFRWIVNMNTLHGDAELAPGAEERHPLTKVYIENGLFYAHKLDTNLYFEKVAQDRTGNATQREAFGNVAETIGIKIEGEEVSFTIRIDGKEETHSLKRVDGLPFKIEIRNMDYSIGAVYSDMPDYYKYLSSPAGDRFDLTPIVEPGSGQTADGGSISTKDFCHPIVVDDPPSIDAL